MFCEPDSLSSGNSFWLSSNGVTTLTSKFSSISSRVTSSNGLTIRMPAREFRKRISCLVVLRRPSEGAALIELIYASNRISNFLAANLPALLISSCRPLSPTIELS